MLRIIVISLFVANLLLLGFQKDNPVVQPESTVTQPVVMDSSIPTIHLFSEIIEDQDLLSGNRRCFSLGPFHAIGEQDEIKTRLQEITTSISERQTEALVEKGYWVFMPPFTSLLEANEELMSLQALGLKDIGVVYSGDWKNAISLGYFMRRENALRRQKELEDRGYETLMRVQRQAEPRYWLEYEQSPGSELITLDMQNRPNDFMQRALPCPEQDLFEVADADSQGLVEELAQKQIPEEENDPVPGENAGSSESIESILQEPVETMPGSTGEVATGELIDAAEAIENKSSEVAGALLDQAAETDPDTPGEVGSGEETDDFVNDIENTPQDTVETLTGAAVETDSQGTGEADSGEEVDAAQGAGALLGQSVETGLESTVKVGNTEADDAAEGNENEPVESAGALPDRAVETVPDAAVEVGSGEAMEVAGGIENTPQETIETLTNPAVENDPESTGEVAEPGEETEAAQSIQNALQDDTEATLNRAVGTGPEWYGEPEAGEETDAVEGVENASVEDTEDLLNPDIEAESGTSGDTETFEG